MSCSLWDGLKGLSPRRREDPPGRRRAGRAPDQEVAQGPRSQGRRLVGTGPACLPEVLETHCVLCLGFQLGALEPSNALKVTRLLFLFAIMGKGSSYN